MSNCHCQGFEKTFGNERVLSNLKKYQAKGLPKTSRVLIDELIKEGVLNMTLLDIGGGLGVIQYELLKAGASRATAVDASESYIAVAQEETKQKELQDKITHQYGDFVALAAGIELADIVTLDRVICCYDDMPSLVTLSAQRAKKLYGVVYPRDTWWRKLMVLIPNLFLRLTGNIHLYIHSTAAVEKILAEQGFDKKFHRNMGTWQVAVFARNNS